MPFTIAAAQSASIPGDLARNIVHHAEIAALAARHGAQLILFPELSLTGYELALGPTHALLPDSPALNPLRALAAAARITIVAGAPLRHSPSELHIAAFILSPTGTIKTYSKQHVHSSEAHIFTSGPGGPPLAIAPATIALAICADASHPAHAAHAAAGGATIYAAGVMIGESAYAPKTALLQGYARDHHMAALLANYSGITGGELSAGKSALWSADGRLIAACSAAHEELLIGVNDNGRWTAAVLPLPPVH